MEQVIFILLSVVTLGSALLVVLQRNLFRAALFLVVTLTGVAGLFVLLEAGFLAMVQIFIYAGAIAILILFAVMLTRRVMNPDTPQMNSQSAAAAGLALVLFVIVALTLLPESFTTPEVNLGPIHLREITLGGVEWQESEVSPITDEDAIEQIKQLGQDLVDSEKFVVPFEVASVLLLVAMVGAVYIVHPRRHESLTDAEIANIQPGGED